MAGLMTEASPLTYPENASIAESNCIIFRKGNRSRRLGFDYEDNYTTSPYSLAQSLFPTVATKEFTWTSVNKDATKNFLVHQLGLTLYFYDHAVSPLSAGLFSNSIDLTPYVTPYAVSPQSGEVGFASGKGYLFIAGENIEPLIIIYDDSLKTFTPTRIYIQIRDFIGVDDGLANDEEPTTLTLQHKYNLKNQGWIPPQNDGAGPLLQYYDSYGNTGQYASGTTADPIPEYFTKWARYPGNNKQWWVAKAQQASSGIQIGDFDPNLLNKFYFGNAHAPRGHFVFNAFYKDRSAVSGVAGIPVEFSVDRPPTVAFFSGRVWFACDNSIYYSMILDDQRKAGFCYQEADPTSEQLSDLIASDGGVIEIPELARAIHLVAIGGGVLVFGTNGVWFITGTTSGFSATSISTIKVSPIGTKSPNSVVETYDSVYWWSDVGIQGMSSKTGLFGPISGDFQQSIVTLTTIQTFWNDIPAANKPFVKAVYDSATNVVQWLYNSQENPVSPYVYDSVLNYDLTLKSFYPWQVSSNGPLITGCFNTPELNTLDIPTQIKNTFNKFIFVNPVGSSSYNFAFGFFKNNSFTDFQQFDTVGASYLSFMETGYEILNDAERKKQTPYVFTYFRRTEQNYVSNGSGDFALDTPSSCYFQTKWDWSSSNVSNKWSSKIQAYRLNRIPVFDETDLTFDTGYPLVVTKNKVRGIGKSIQFRFENGEPGTDFDLLGWATEYTGLTQP